MEVWCCSGSHLIVKEHSRLIGLLVCVMPRQKHALHADDHQVSRVVILQQVQQHLGGSLIRESTADETGKALSWQEVRPVVCRQSVGAPRIEAAGVPHPVNLDVVLAAEGALH